MQRIDEQANDRCYGCGDIAAFCDSAACALVLQGHVDGDHGSCDVFVCDSAEWEDVG